MYVTVDTLITAGAVLGAIVSFVTLFWKLFKWIDHQKEQDQEIADMKIKQVQYEKLFGFFDYSIDFHETVTIIHGPNGCGKTTMLKIMDAVFNKKLGFTYSLIFFKL